MLRALGAALVVGAVVVVGLLFLGPVVRGYYCDGAAPKWMLDAQNYDGGGCYEVLPEWQKPPNADETLICLGVCLMTPAPEPLGPPY